MSNAEIYRVSLSPWARARTGALLVWAFASGYTLAVALRPVPELRDWSKSSGSGKATLYDPNTGITQIQEQSGTTESLTVHDPARFDLFHGTSANE